ncbi:hypothetical protein C2S52_009171 [Perilla frutescens var. hirtella]|nr:hypothetical protein C2S52_009171 [Perilla frutescens var. hirtella]
MVSKDGGSTPSSGHGLFLPGLDNINLEADFEAEVKRNVVHEDSVVGTDQKLDQFWVRVATKYNNNRPSNTPVRPDEALKTHYYTVQRSIAAFNAEYISVKQGWRNGHNDADILMEALKKWEHNYNGQSFKLLGMWQILKDCPKWNNSNERDHRGKKKMKIPMSEVYTSSSNNDDVEERVRPMGQKAAKKKEKWKGKTKIGGAPSLQDVQALISEQMERMNSIALEAHNIMVAEIKKKCGMQ